MTPPAFTRSPAPAPRPRPAPSTPYRTPPASPVDALDDDEARTDPVLAGSVFFIFAVSLLRLGQLVLGHAHAGLPADPVLASLGAAISGFYVVRAVLAGLRRLSGRAR